MTDRNLWTWFMAAGVVILVLLGLHMVTMHLDDIFGVNNPAGGAAITYANVVARGKSAAIMLSYILLLGAALIHGLYGLRNILFELGLGRGLKQAISTLLVIVGLGLFAYGTWAAWASFQVALNS